MKNTITDQQLLEQQSFEKNYLNKKRFGKYFNSFSSSLAVEIGVNEAIFIQKLHQLIISKKNRHNEGGFRWYFNTFDTWQKEYFPYWSEKTIIRIVYKLRGEAVDEHGKLKKEQIPALIVTTDEHNKLKYYKDHTLWYRINYVELHKLLTKNGSSTQVKASQNDQPMSSQTDQPMSSQTDRSSTTMEPHKEPPTRKNGGGNSLDSNHEDSKANPTDFVSRGDSVSAGGVEEAEFYKPLTQIERYEIAKSLLIDPNEVVAAEKDVLSMFFRGELKKLTSTKETVIAFLEARIRKGDIEAGNPEMMLHIESEHPLDKARDKCVLFEMKIQQIHADGQSLVAEYEESGNDSLLAKKDELETKLEKIKPKFEKTYKEFLMYKNLYPNRFAARYQ